MAQRERAIDRRQFLSSLAAVGLGATSAGTLAAPARAGAAPARVGADWPVYRHDRALTGVSGGTGRIAQPRILWEYYLGAPYGQIATRERPPGAPLDPRSPVADLDGDGRLERLVVDGRTLRVTDMAGRTLWTHTVDGLPLGGNVRVCGLLPGSSRGFQVISFSSRMDTGEGQGYCFDFRRGADKGELVWTTGPLTGQHAPTLVVDDVDGDGLPEIVTAPHYRVQIFNGQTGALKAEVPWDVGRNYGALVTRPRRDRPQKDVYIVSDFVLHVDCIRFGASGWAHAWGHRYVDPNAPARSGREKYLRVGPTPVVDIDGDERDEVVYMLVDATDDDQWHLRVRDAETGTVKADIAGIWLWTIADLDGDGRLELVYTPTKETRPTTRCPVHVARLTRAALTDVAVLGRVRPLLMQASLPLTVDTNADQGLVDLLRTDPAGDGLPALFYARSTTARGVDDVLEAASLAGTRRAVARPWRFSLPGHRLNLVSLRGSGPDGRPDTVSVRDLTGGRALTVDARGRVVGDTALGRVGGFTTTPIAADIDGDGRNEIVVQNAACEIVALRPGPARNDPPTILWSRPGVAMNHSPGYAWNGALSPQAADVDGDGRPEVVFAAEDARGHGALTCVDGTGRLKWRHSTERCVWGGLQAGVDLWTFGRFTGRPRGLDVYVDLHRRCKGSGEGWVLHGATGAVVWRQAALVAKETAMPFGGGLPAVADIDGDGLDELVQMSYSVYGAVSGDTGEPLFPPALLSGPNHLGKWLAYSWPTVADLNGDGRPEVYLNRASGAYAAVHIDGTPMWASFHNNDLACTGSGPVGDLDGDGECEVAVPVQNGTLLCLGAADGSQKWTRRTPVAGDVVAADIDGDGQIELVFAGHDGKIHAVRGRDGQELWAIRAGGCPIIADVNGDGFVEIVAVGGDGVLRVIG